MISIDSWQYSWLDGQGWRGGAWRPATVTATASDERNPREETANPSVHRRGGGSALRRPSPMPPPTDAGAGYSDRRRRRPSWKGAGPAGSTWPGRRYSGWWHGCRFHITESPVTFHEAPNGRRIAMVGAPEPVPPREPGCVDREPTEAAIDALRAEVIALNARGRPPGAPEPPPLPPSRSGQPSLRP